MKLPSLALLVFALAFTSACTRSPERAAQDSEQRARKNLADRAAIAKEGARILTQQGLLGCGADAIIAASDPDRLYLACNGFASPAGDDPHLLEFRTLYGKDDDSVWAACHDSKLDWPAVRQTFCQDIFARRRAKAGELRPRYESEGRCKIAALREAADPDADYFVCYGSTISFNSFRPEDAHLREFRSRHGPEVAKIREQCPALRARYQLDRRSPDFNSPPHREEVARFGAAYLIFCTDEQP